MFLPWFVLWAPQYHFPWSGSVAQQIEPTLGAFFNAIPANAGDKDVERQAFDVASYGKQLGWLTEAVLQLAGGGSVSKEQARDALNRLKQTHEKVEKLKQRKREADLDRMMILLEDMRVKRPKSYAMLIERLQSQA